MTTFLSIAAVGYLLGSIPFGYLLVRFVRGEDVRRSGSGNIGATNVARKSPILGVVTLLLDAAKGAGAVALAYVIADHAKAVGIPSYTHLSLGALFAVTGHIFPVWLKFRGGKGVATGLGAFAILAPKAVLIAAAIFLVLVLAFRYVSLGSVVAVALFPSLAWTLHEFGEWQSLGFMGLAALLIVLKHSSNIARLLTGTENRFGQGRRVSSDQSGGRKS
ncbi:MAG TPA: glycerol-3-phosphate 1-O-acyltransferase PlsY [Verrucomicrobiae bacterium]|jgi:acyl phosphate:glycerol-3-phosphate acyltransferase|nr:glycerol-3-phosphate 1-O-acyltransferase PlsY [Verrucomicrobiae bacterium]